MPDTTLKIEFESSDAARDVAVELEQHVRKATEPLRCPHHFPGRVSLRADREQVRVVDGCCAPFVEKAREAITVIVAQWRVLRKIRNSTD
jgi:hypothetical protein